MEYLKGINGVYFLAAVLAAAALAQAAFPWRREPGFGVARWLRAGALAFYGGLLVQFIPFLSGYAAALAAEGARVGLLNRIEAPLWAQIPLAVAAADFLAYAQHRALHAWPPLWRTHRLHHADPRVDASTALRFHPFETAFRGGVDAGAVALLGLPPEGVLASFAVLTVINVLTHTNVVFPLKLESLLARAFITPRVHKLHHSSEYEQHERNFGTLFSFWDRMAGTFIEPAGLSGETCFGLPELQALPRESFGSMILDPFRNPVAARDDPPALESEAKTDERGGGASADA